MADYPLDLLAAPLSRRESWLDGYSLPESPDKIWEFYSEIKECYFEAVRKYNGSFMGDVLLAKIKIYMEYTRVLCALNLIQKVRESGANPVCSEKALLFKQLLKDPSSFTNSMRYDELPRMKLSEYIYRRLRKIPYSARVNNSLLYYFHSKVRGARMLNVSPCFESMAYCANMGASFCYALPAEWLRNAYKIRLDNSLQDEINTVSNEIVKSLKEAANRRGLKVSESVYAKLYAVTERHLEAGARELKAIMSVMKGREKLHVLGGNQSSFFNRAMALCCKKLGGRTTGFNHGNDAFSSRDFRFELSIVDEFVTYSSGGAELIRNRDRTALKPLTSNEPEISSLEVPRYFDLWKRFKDAPLPKQVKTVMVFGFPFDPVETLTYGPPDTAFYYQEARIIDALKKAGFEVIYKAHPEGYVKYPKIQGEEVKIITDPFESVMDAADAYVFSYSFTSVFPPALCTNKPAVLVDTMNVHRHHTPEVYSILEKRCKVLKVGVDDKNRFVFDTDAMIEHLRKTPETPDTELLEKYMFPFDYKI